MRKNLREFKTSVHYGKYHNREHILRQLGDVLLAEGNRLPPFSWLLDLKIKKKIINNNKQDFSHNQAILV